MQNQTFPLILSFGVCDPVGALGVQADVAAFAALGCHGLSAISGMMVADSARVEHVYEHAHVRLHFYISRDWRGEPQSLEGQAFAWQGTVGLTPLLPATIPLLAWLDQLRYAG